ncbi:MAG: hypothetical protein WKG00_25975 [Polyangiaceae bacterium]
MMKLSGAALADIAALILAMAFDPEAVAAQAERARIAGAAAGAPPVARTAPAPNPSSRARDAANDDPATRAGSSGFVGARLGGDSGSMLVPAVGLTLAGGLAWERLRLELEGTWWFEREVALEGEPQKGGTFSFVSGALAGCGVALETPVELGACGALEVGRIQAEGHGVQFPEEASMVWVAGRATVNAAFPLTEAVWLRADAGVAVPVIRTAWALHDDGMVGTSPAVAGRIAAGPEIRF